MEKTYLIQIGYKTLKELIFKKKNNVYRANIRLKFIIAAQQFICTHWLKYKLGFCNLKVPIRLFIGSKRYCR
jgi:hypothetical protein